MMHSTKLNKKIISDLPDPSSQDDFDYLVACLAWEKGLAANAIARSVFGEEKGKLAASLMKVKQALARAHKKSFLKLFPPPNAGLAKELQDKISSIRKNSRVKFHVVDDHVRAGQVAAKAAAVISDIVLLAVNEKVQPTALQDIATMKGHWTEIPDVVICNGGGRTVSEAVKVLTRYPPALDESEEKANKQRLRLLFIAANAAYKVAAFNHSSSFLSVKLAELYDAKHLALPGVVDQNFLADHRRIIAASSLFICGAGAKEFGLMGLFLSRNNFALPDQAVGDLCFNMLDKDGDGLEPPTHEARAFVHELNPTLNLTVLSQLATNAHVVLILDCEIPEEKAIIGAAILKKEYATEVVLGTRLARAILKIL